MTTNPDAPWAISTQSTVADHPFDAVAKFGERLVVVVPHPDDETFGCGSLIAQAVHIGATVTVICATRGEAGERVDGAETADLPLAHVRERELRHAAAVLGAHRVVVLDHADSAFDGPLPERALCGVDVETLASEMKGWLREIEPHSVVTLDGSDGHRDHVHLRSAIELAISRMVDQPRLVLSSLANSLMRQWADEMRSANPETVYLEADVAALGRPDEQLVRIDAGPFVEIREQAIACHRSQRSPYDGLSHQLRRAFLATDFVDVGCPRSPVSPGNPSQPATQAPNEMDQR
jgi:LmbE family N-acetylglucosaminyl deacetylase